MGESLKIRPVGWTGPGGAKVVAHWRATAAMDNHTPTRNYSVAMLEEWVWPPREDGFVGLEFVIVGGLDAFPRAEGARWILDDGESVRLMYSAGYHPKGRYVGIKTYPSGDVLGDGPRTVYHLIVKKVDA